MRHSYEHEPHCAIIRETDPDARMVSCTCSEKHRQSITRLRERGGVISPTRIGGDMSPLGSLDSGCYYHRSLKTGYT